MCRTAGFFLFTSSIYESSKKPLKITRTIPNSGWFQELERFNDQVHTEVNSLTGMKFFYLTKSALLALAGMILTYDLVLLQYSTTEADLDAWGNCQSSI